MRSIRNVLPCLAIILLIAGCAHHRYWVSRPVRQALAMHARQVPADHCSARVNYNALEVTLDVRETVDHFELDFQLEGQHADMALQAIAKSTVVFDQYWDTLELEMRTQYGRMTWQTPSSFFYVGLSREQMEVLRAQDIRPGAAARMWHREFCTKNGLRREGLDWPPGSPVPLERQRRK